MVANPIDFPCKSTMISIFYVSEVWITIRRQPTAPNLIVFWMAFVVAPVIMKSIDPLMRPRLCRSVGKKSLKVIPICFLINEEPHKKTFVFTVLRHSTSRVKISHIKNVITFKSLHDS